MARSSLALCVVLAMSGCGAVASRTSETTDDLLVRAVPGDGDVLGAPSGVEVPSQRMTSLLPPKAFGLGYFWIGYAATDKALVRKVSPGEQADGDRQSANEEKIEQWKRHWVGFAGSIRAWGEIRKAAGVG